MMDDEVDQDDSRKIIGNIIINVLTPGKTGGPVSEEGDAANYWDNDEDVANTITIAEEEVLETEVVDDNLDGELVVMESIDTGSNARAIKSEVEVAERSSDNMEDGLSTYYEVMSKKPGSSISDSTLAFLTDQDTVGSILTDEGESVEVTLEGPILQWYLSNKEQHNQKQTDNLDDPSKCVVEAQEGSKDYPNYIDNNFGVSPEVSPPSSVIPVVIRISQNDKETEHFKVDDSNNVFCNECGIWFNNEASHSVHQDKFHSNRDTQGEDIKPADSGGSNQKVFKLFMCSLCTFGCTSEEELMKHVYDEHVEDGDDEEVAIEEGEVYGDDDGEDVKPTIFSAVKHAKGRPKGSTIGYNKKNRFVYQCSVCNYQTQSRSYLVVHMRHHTGERPFTCEECNKSFSQKAHLTVHERVVHPEQCQLPPPIFSCPKCDYSTRVMSNLRSHMHVHTGQKPYKCQYCNKQFAQKSYLPKHIRKFHGKGVNPKRRTTSLDRNFECSEANCAYQCATAEAMERHLLIHSGEGPYKCEHCGRCLATARTYQNHLINTHISPKIYQCHVCLKVYSTHYKFQRHLLFHSGDKRFVCEFCGKSFYVADAMKRHVVVVHHKLRPYSCSLCEYVCGSSGHLKQHLIYCHGQKTDHQCHYCSKFFPCVSHLTEHMKKHVPHLYGRFSNSHSIDSSRNHMTSISEVPIVNTTANDIQFSSTLGQETRMLTTGQGGHGGIASLVGVVDTSMFGGGPGTTVEFMVDDQLHHDNDSNPVMVSLGPEDIDDVMG